MKASDFFSACEKPLNPDAFVWDAIAELKHFLNGVAEKIESEIPNGAVLLNKESICIGPGCVIEPGALIEGPCVIGPKCVVRFGAAVRASVLYEGALVGHASEIKRSILLKGAKAPHFNYVGDAILGQNVNLGAGAKFANLRLDRKEICIKIKDRVLQTGLKKFGGVLGDGCQVGCNTLLNPGTLVAPNKMIAPCSKLQGFIR